MPNIGQLVAVKLARDTYLLWKAQVVPILRAYQLLGFVDGSIVAPPRLVPASNADDAPQVVNPIFTNWHTQDQLLLSGLLSTLSLEVLARVMLHTSSKAVWSALETMFSSSSRARIVQLCKQLSMVQKKDSSMTDYFARVKGMADQLASTDDDIMTYFLTGLDNTYDALVTSLSVMVKTEPISLDHFYSLMLDHEVRQEISSYHQISVNTAGRGNGGRNNAGGGCGGRGSSPGNANRDQQSGTNAGTSGGNNKKPRVQCQLCKKFGHEAFKCHNRFNHNFQPDDQRNVNNVSSGAGNFDPAWYTDSGATDHITGELDKLNVREQYSGKDQVHTASGSGMIITHVGNSVIHTPSRSFQLKEVLHVPHTTKNLCAVGRLTTDNNVSVEYFPNSFVIKDLVTRRVLFQGPSEGGLYPISSSSSSR